MSHSHLTMEERIRIEVFVSEGLSCRKIVRRLGRRRTTIARELHRNSSKSGYRAQTADHRARKRRKIPRYYRCMSRPELIAWVDEKLRDDWSPEQIAGRIRVDYPRDPNMRISTETLYHWIYAAAQVGDTSYRHLRCAHRRRRRQTRYGQGRRHFPGRVDISERPQLIAERVRSRLVGGFQLQKANRELRDYDSQGRLLAVTQAKGMGKRAFLPAWNGV